MATDNRCGLMALSTRVSGKMTRPTALASSFMQMVTFTKVSGRMIKLTATEATHMLMEPPI
jgi:hypothetical protein